MDDLSDRLRELAFKLIKNNPLSVSHSLAADHLVEAAKELDHRQYLIDNLMLEYCPEAMAKDQLEEWAKHQVAV